MAYGHAERNLALIQQLEAETRQLLESLDQLDAEQLAWLQRTRVATAATNGPTRYPTSGCRRSPFSLLSVTGSAHRRGFTDASITARRAII